MEINNKFQDFIIFDLIKLKGFLTHQLHFVLISARIFGQNFKLTKRLNAKNIDRTT